MVWWRFPARWGFSSGSSSGAGGNFTTLEEDIPVYYTVIGTVGVLCRGNEGVTLNFRLGAQLSSKENVTSLRFGVVDRRLSCQGQ